MGVVSNLLQEENKAAYTLKIREEYELFKEKFLARTTAKEYLSYEAARQNPFPIAWDDFESVVPQQLGAHTLEDFPLAELVPYIDWI